MEAVRECYVLVGRFGRRVLCWVHLGGEEAPSDAKSEQHLAYDLLHHDDKEDQNECAICTESLDEGGDVLRLPCNDKHIFHVACIRQWAAVNLTCPLDRKPIPPEALIKLSLFNTARLYTSIFLEEVISGASQYLLWSHSMKDSPVNLLGIAIGKCSSTWVERIDAGLYGPAQQGAPLPAWSRKPVLKVGQVAFHVLLWTAYSSIGYTSLVLHYLLRQSFETQGQRLCQHAIQLGNVGYDYEATKPLVGRTRLSVFLKVVGFMLGLAVVGREVRRGTQHLASTVVGYVSETLPLTPI